MDNTFITVFTPTYNRINELERLHLSLISQTDSRFEWLIVDDGSTDDTENIVASWLDTSPFSIRYIKQPNSGKHVAHNHGAAAASGEYFICVDSDDWLEPNAVETILHDITALDTEEGLLYPRLHPKQTALDTWFPDGVDKIELADMRMKYGLVIETAIVFNTDVLRRHPFPVVQGERFMPEGSAYYDFVAPELFCVHDEPFYRSEYLEEGLTKNIWKNWYANPAGVRMALCKRLKAADRYPGIRSLREKVAAISGLESLNLATSARPFDGLGGFTALGFVCFPIAVGLCKKRFGGLA